MSQEDGLNKSKIRITVFGAPGVGKRSLTWSFLHFIDNWIRESSEYQSYYDLPKDVFNTSKDVTFCHIAFRNTRYLSLMLRSSRPDLILLVTDSTPNNIELIKNQVPKIRIILPKARILVVANKQELPFALSPEKIEKDINIPTMGFIAIDQYDKAQRIILSEKIADILGFTLGLLGETGVWEAKKC